MILQDFKYALRLLAKKPGFTLLTTLVMATGIGLSVYLFTFFNSVLFKDLPFEDSASLVVISGSESGRPIFRRLNLHDYAEIKNSINGLAEFNAYTRKNVNVLGRDGARRYTAIYSEPGIFKSTRTKPLLGREFTQQENQPGAEKVAIIGFDMWQNLYGADPDVIEQTMRINGENHKIIAVMPEGYLFPNIADLWVPLAKSALNIPRNESDSVYILAHLQPGITKENINGQLAVIMKRIAQRFPKTNHDVGAYADALSMSSVGEGIAVVYSLLIVAVLILVLASINVGNLLLSRAIERSKETAIRVALGAPRARLISQMLWESIIICCLGGVIGLLVVAWGLEITETITATFFAGKPSFWWKFSLDSFAIKLFFAFVLSTIVVTGLLPAWKNSGGDFNSALRDGTRGALSKKAGRLNRVLVISEILISIIVLIVAAIWMLSSYLQTNNDHGADTDNVLVANVLLPENGYESAAKQVQFIKTLQSRLEQGAGITQAMIITTLPGESVALSPIAIEGKQYDENKGYPKANYIKAMPGSLSKLGVELKQGRYFNSSDDGLENKTVIVTDSFVKRHFDKKLALGKRVRVVQDNDQVDWLTIVGVVEHTTQGSEERGRVASIFRPITQDPTATLTIAMRMKVNRVVATDTLRATLKTIDPQIPAYEIESYQQKLDRLSAPIRFISKVLLMFGSAAVVLAGSGIYGVMSNTISQRTQEIGVKRALGADDERITKELLLSGFKQLLWGAVPGLSIGVLLGVAMGSNARIGDSGLTIITVAVGIIVGGIVMLATYLPTKRALNMEPSQALHQE